MAITAAQRNQAVTLLLQNYGNPSLLAHYIAGLTPAGLVSAIVGAIGTNFDVQLSSVLATLVTDLNSQLAGTQSSVTAIQAQITAATVA